MAPTGFLSKLKSLYSHGEKPIPPPFTVATATLILVAYTIVYVAPFYLSSTTRPSPTLYRDSPTVIRARIRSVTISSIICSLCTLGALVNYAKVSSSHEGFWIALHHMGYYPLGIMATIRSMVLVVILFTGPLFEAAIVEGAWRDWIRLRGIRDILGSWTGYRNLVAGPITEEILFRSAAVPLFLLAHASTKPLVFGTPLIFGLAHVHHCYEFTITHPGAPIWQAILQSIVQLAYTALFGSFTTFVFLRTGSLLAVILLHMFCNWMGLPRFWGRLQAIEVQQTVVGDEVGSGKRDSQSAAVAQPSGGLLLTVVYYILLVGGAYGFYKNLWQLTDSPHALVEF